MPVRKVRKIRKVVKKARKYKSSKKKPTRKRLTIGIGPAKVKIKKVFFKKLYNDPKAGTQMHFQGMGPRKWKFDASVKIPADSFARTKKHIGRNKMLYAHGVGVGLSGVTAYGGTYLANRRNRGRR